MKKTKTIFCLLLIAALLLSVTACKKSPSEEDSGSVDIEYIYQYADGTTADPDGDSGDDAQGNVANSSSGKTEGDSGNKKPSVDKNTAEKYRGTTVRFATWKDPYQNEDGVVVKAFEKEYGIKVKVDMVGQLNYAHKIAGMIASGDSPDVYFANNDFPAALSCLQPLDVSGIDMSDPIWDQGMFKNSTVNGKAYLVNTVGNIWNEVDCVFYNKRLLKENNITTPEEYYKAGKWNFDTMTKVMRDVKALGSDYIGGYIDWETMLGLTGSSFYKWENGKFSNGVDNTLIEVMRRMATYYKEGLVRGYFDTNFRDEFIQGKVGIAITNAFGLKKTGYWTKMNADDVGFTYLPDFDANTKAKTTGLFRGWGIIKGAKNPGGAGVFLRYYLDVNNYDTSIAFLNNEAETFFFKITSGATSDKKFSVIRSGCDTILGTTPGTFGSILYSDPTQVASSITALQNTINNHVNTLNEYVQKQIS